MGSASKKDEITPEWGLSRFDPWDNRLNYKNIWSIYREMRHTAPVVYSEAHGGIWCISRYEDVRSAARDFKTFSSQNVMDIGNANKNTAPRVRRLIELDPPEHTVHRKVMQVPFLASRVGEFSDGIRTSIRELLDKVEKNQEFDIVTDIAEPVPQDVLAKVLGFDDESRIKNRELVLRFVNADLGSRRERQEELRAFLLEKIREKTENPGDDYLSQMCMSEHDGERFTEAELVGMVQGFALAGHHTSINAIASMLYRLSDENIKDLYLSDPKWGSKIVEETLRLDPPIHLEGRTTTVATSVGGIKIPADQSVALIYASANHDESRFEQPETFLPQRSSLQHLAFGHGIHMCIGMNLARLEMNIILEEVMSRIPNYQLAGEPEDSGMVFGHHMGWEKMPATVSQ